MPEQPRSSRVEQRAIQTTRLTLTPLVVADTADLHPSLQEPALYAFIPQEPPESIAWLEARYSRLEQRRSPDGSEIWLNWVVRRRDDLISVGTVEATIRADRMALLAYTIFTAHQRRGYASEACRAIVDHLGRTCGVVCVLADVDTRNLASIALLERLGFVKIATTIAADTFKGASSDDVRFAFWPPA